MASSNGKRNAYSYDLPNYEASDSRRKPIIDSWRGMQATLHRELQRPSVFGLFDAKGSVDRSSGITSVISPSCSDERVDFVDDVQDQTDFIPDSMRINIFEVLFYAWGVLGFFVDFASDALLSHAYYREGKIWLFAFTLACAIAPNVTLSLFSLAWQLDEQLNPNKTEFKSFSVNDVHNDKIVLDDDPDTHIFRANNHTSSKRCKDVDSRENSLSSDNFLLWSFRALVLLLQLDLCVKYIKGFVYTYRGYCYGRQNDRRWEKYYLCKQIHIDADIALLRVFDVFMDSGSQVVLQLYVISASNFCHANQSDCGLNIKQLLSIFSSLLSLGYAIAGYNRCLRHMLLTHKRSCWPVGKPIPSPVPLICTAVNFLWCLVLITPRVIAFALFASTCGVWFWLFLVFHWAVMFIWIVQLKTSFCMRDPKNYSFREFVLERCYNLVTAYIYLFCYMNLKEGNTRYRYVFYYTIFYIENLFFSFIYFNFNTDANQMYKAFMICTITVGFVLAILLQIIYYLYFHPCETVREKLQNEFLRSRKSHKRENQECNINCDFDDREIDMNMKNSSAACLINSNNATSFTSLNESVANIDRENVRINDMSYTPIPLDIKPSVHSIYIKCLETAKIRSFVPFPNRRNSRSLSHYAASTAEIDSRPFVHNDLSSLPHELNVDELSESHCAVEISNNNCSCAGNAKRRVRESECDVRLSTVAESGRILSTSSVPESSKSESDFKQ